MARGENHNAWPVDHGSYALTIRPRTQRKTHRNEVQLENTQQSEVQLGNTQQSEVQL
jgi:hypothetical protein